MTNRQLIFSYVYGKYVAGQPDHYQQCYQIG
ncbi:hypothetical protein CLV58_1359 [Spirosoma oryzae]|uniref:Uncharacterized protein n=1 Tax=Spirosoma oryzae TaxID=1469603 RepID=A0A2T0S0P8_9BACT|nr:hypothetical protein CLV58_1359 [Spirosoma oryzae]